MQTTSNVIDKNWKALIKPNKLEITSSEDKSIAKVVAEPIEKGVGQTIKIALVGSRFGTSIYDVILSLNKSEVIKRLKAI